MPTDTRSLFQRPGLPLRTGAPVANKNNVPGTYQSQDINGRPRTGLTMVQTTPPAPVAPITPPRTGLTPAPLPAAAPQGSFEEDDNPQADVAPAAQPQPTAVASSSPAPRVMAPPPPPVAQTEGSNPLSGDGTKQPQGTTTTLPSAAPMGFSSRGAAVPAGQDANPNVGGVGPYARTFKDPRAASIYHDYTRRLFSANTGSTAGAPDQN